MKKLLSVFAAVAAFMMVSCSKEVATETVLPEEEGLVRMTFLASAEDATKVSLDSDGQTAKWTAGDQIAVYDGIVSTANIFTANSSGTTTSFTGTVSGGATNFVAVYPASAAVALGDGDKPISAIIPNVQEATLNGFDPAAALYVAESTDLEAKFAFKAAFALMKVNVNVDDVVAVTVENTKNNFAGSVNVSTSAGVSNGTGTTYKKITLKKSDGSVLAKGVYYIVVRHVGETSTYENFKLTYVTSGALVGERTTDTVLDNSVIGRKCVLNLGGLSTGFTVVQSWYAYYQAGFDVTIGSKTINVGTDGDATLWTADNDVYAMTKSPIEAGGIFFLKAVGTGTFNQPNNPTVTKMTCFLSDTDSNVDVAFANVFNIADDATLCFKGVNATMTGSKSSYLSVNKNSSKSAAGLVVDRCTFPLYYSSSASALVATNSTYKAYGVTDIEIVNSSFPVKVAVNVVNISDDTTGITEYKSFKFNNNYVYSITTDTNILVSVFKYTGSGGDGDMVAEVNNNLFYNAIAGGTFKHNTIASATSTKNVFWAVDGADPGANAKLWGMKTKSAIPSVSVTDNVAFGTLNGSRKWTIADSTVNTGMDALVVLDSDPVASANVSTGVFTMAAGYESYGPQD